MSIKLLRKTIKFMINANQEKKELNLIPLITGGTGEGKTEFYKQLANELDYNFVYLPVSFMEDTADLTGMFSIDSETGTTVYHKPEWFPKGDKPTLLFIDEINRVKPHIKAPLMIMLNQRVSGVHKLPDNVMMVAAMNPPTDDYDTDSSGATTDGDAYLNRFVHFEFKSTNSEWAKYTKNAGGHNGVVDFFLKNQEFMPKGVRDFDIQQFIKISKRTYTQLALALSLKPEEDVLRTLVFGMVPQDVAISVINYLKDYKETLDVKELVENFNNESVEHLRRVYNESDLLSKFKDDLVKYLQSKTKFSKKIHKNMVSILENIPSDFCIFLLRDIASSYEEGKAGELEYKKMCQYIANTDSVVEKIKSVDKAV